MTVGLAFDYFKNQNVDIAVIEVGMGGRLDSTNIIEPLLSVITNISLDHTKFLGNSLKEIAKEKAGIIKVGKPVVIGDLDAESLKVIKEVALASKSTIISAEELAPEFDRGEITINQNQVFYTSLAEPINRWNVAMVVQTVETMQPIMRVSSEELKKGIEEESSSKSKDSNFLQTHRL